MNEAKHKYNMTPVSQIEKVFLQICVTRSISGYLDKGSETRFRRTLPKQAKYWSQRRFYTSFKVKVPAKEAIFGVASMVYFARLFNENYLLEHLLRYSHNRAFHHVSSTSICSSVNLKTPWVKESLTICFIKKILNVGSLRFSNNSRYTIQPRCLMRPIV